MTVRKADVDLRQGQYLVSTYSKTPMGVWVVDGLPAFLPDDATADQLGAAIRDALARCRDGIPELTRDSKPAQPLLDFLGLPNYATYMKGTRLVGVYSKTTDDSETIHVTPMRNEGARKGFTSIIEERQTFTYTSPEQLGAAVIKAFTKAISP
jgi:hypothetical protein